MFALRLKQLREDAELSQYAFAEKLGIAQSTVGNWEAGKREPNFDTICKIAEFFGVSTDYLIGYDDAASYDSVLEDAQEDEFAWLNELSADEIAERCYTDFKILFSRSNKSTQEQMKGFYIDTYKRFKG